MGFTGRPGVWKAIAIGLITAWTVSLAATPAQAVNNRYLNLHQCVYTYNGGWPHYTNLLPNTPNTPFNTGTNSSNNPDSPPAQCGDGAGGWGRNWINTSVESFDLMGKRYLNLHQCVYNNNGGWPHYTNLLPNTPHTTFNTGTNVSDTRDTAVVCGQGDEYWQRNYINTAVASFDLIGKRYLNLHQCVYNHNEYHYTNLLPNTPHTTFNTGTNVSNTRDTVVSCGDGDEYWHRNTVNSAVYSLELWW